MGYTTSIGHFGHTIRKFWPDDTDDIMYLEGFSQHSLASIIEMCRKKWPDTDFNDLLFEAEHIQTRSIGYDLPDLGDFTDFIVIRRAAK